jgi:tetratricopeptide (TPR) repeat protein
VLLAVAIPALLACAVYANSLANGLVYDDVSVIAENEAVRDPLDLRTIFLTPSWYQQGNPTILYRPLATWTFALNHALHGLDPPGYHLVNVLLHAGASALLVALALELGLPVAVAGLAGILFAVHPIHTEAVANVVGRAELLAAALVFVALGAARRAANGARPLGASVVAVAAYGLALLAKEHVVAVLVLVPLADLVFAHGGSPRTFLAHLRGRRLVLYLGLVAATGGYLLLRWTALGGVIGAANAIGFWMNPTAFAPPLPRVLTALEVQALAVWLLFVPLHLSADYSFRQIPVVTSPAEPGAIAGLLVALGLVVLAVVLWRRDRAAFFWLALAFAGRAVVSNLIVPVGTIFGERQLYLPSAGFAVLLAIGLARVAEGRGRRPAIVLAVALAAAWGVRAAWRNAVWRSDLGLAEATVRDAPESSHARHVLGLAYAALGRDEDALGAYGEALRIYPEDVASLYNTGVIHQQRDRLAEAIAAFRRVTEIEPTYFPAWINLASADNARGSFQTALAAAERAVAVRADVPNAHVVRGFALRGLGRLEEARAAFEDALRLAPEMPDALMGLGATDLERGDFELAARDFERLVAVAPVRARTAASCTASARRGGRRSAWRCARASRTTRPSPPATDGFAGARRVRRTPAGRATSPARPGRDASWPSPRPRRPPSRRSRSACGSGRRARSSP